MLEALAVSNDGERVANDDVCVWCGVFLYTVLNDPVVCGQGTHLFEVHTCLVLIDVFILFLVVYLVPSRPLLS